jgi:cytochrome c
MWNHTSQKVAKIASTVIIAAIMVNPVLGAGNPEKGAEIYQQCVSCHSLEPKLHLTGPSLAGVFDRKAGTASGFLRYSNALKNADVVWDAKSLDAWLKDPRDFLPNNLMSFKGISEPQARQDLIAFLKVANSESSPMTAQHVPLTDLKSATTNQRVTAIRHCADTYHVTLGSGNTYPFWEFNLRFKTDSSKYGPYKGKPAILRASMRGDRAFVIFSTPAEISLFIEEQC